MEHVDVRIKCNGVRYKLCTTSLKKGRVGHHCFIPVWPKDVFTGLFVLRVEYTDEFMRVYELSIQVPTWKLLERHVEFVTKCNPSPGSSSCIIMSDERVQVAVYMSERNKRLEDLTITRVEILHNYPLQDDDVISST